jgi:lipid A 3-O-deacylase
MTKLASAAFLITLLFVSSSNLSAGPGLARQSERGSAKSMCTTAFPFEKGAHEIEFGIGVFGSPWSEGTAKRPDMAFAIGELRAGWMLTDVRGDGVFRGNWEFVFDVFGAGIFDGPGDVLVGAEVLLRYNFIQPGSRLVPFIQIGGGGVYSDASDDDAIQHLIGSDLSFILEGEIGLRWKVRERCAIHCGIDYRHISNAGLAHHNAGVNALGGLIGLSIFY